MRIRFSFVIVGGLVVAGGFSGCGKKKEAKPEKSEAKAEPMKPPAMGPAAKPRKPPPVNRARAAVPAPGTRPRPVAPVARPVVPRPARLPRSAFKPTIKKPKYPVLYRLVRDRSLRNISGWGLGKAAIGGTGFLAVVRGTSKKSDRVRFSLVRLDKKGENWQLTWKLGLKNTGRSFSGAGEFGAASLFVDDYDWDGKPEALVRYRYSTQPKRAVGATEITDLVIVNVHGSRPSIAFATNLHRKPEADSLPSIQGRIKYEDLNNDGFPDIVLKQTEKIMDRRSRSVERYIYVPAVDRYRSLKKARARKTAR